MSGRAGPWSRTIPESLNAALNGQARDTTVAVTQPGPGETPQRNYEVKRDRGRFIPPTKWLCSLSEDRSISAEDYIVAAVATSDVWISRGELHLRDMRHSKKLGIPVASIIGAVDRLERAGYLHLIELDPNQRRVYRLQIPELQDLDKHGDDGSDNT